MKHLETGMQRVRQEAMLKYRHGKNTGGGLRGPQNKDDAC